MGRPVLLITYPAAESVIFIEGHSVLGRILLSAATTGLTHSWRVHAYRLVLADYF